MTPSKYPAPPVLVSVDVPVAVDASPADARHTQGPVDASQQSPEFPRIPPGNAGENRESPTQLNLSESNSSESKLIEDEGEAQPPPNIVPFPAARANADVETHFTETIVLEATQQVATILNIPVTDGLARVVADYQGDSSLSLLGEADAAREWIDDPRRNRKRKPLTPAFFRRWLKREREAAGRGYAPPGAVLQETAKRARPLSAQAGSAPANAIGPPGMPGTMEAVQNENPYQAFVSARAQSVLRHAAGRQEEVRCEASP
jgi:hypothetical protein